MNYIKIYTNLIERGKNRTLDGYSERHHIIPRCIGGEDTEENLVDLTPEEHYVAHQLLVKIFPNEYKLVFAVNMMGQCSANNKVYGWIKRRYSEQTSGENHPNYGIPRTDDIKRRISESRKGHVRSEASKLKQSLTKLAQRGITPEQYEEEKRIKLEEQAARKLEKERLKQLRLDKEQQKKQERFDKYAVNQYSEDGEYIATFNGPKEASRILKIDRTGIMRCLKGQQHSAGGFKWSYRDVQIVPKKKIPEPYYIGRVCKYTLDDVFIAEYGGITEATNDLKKEHPKAKGSNVNLCVIERRISAYGYKWKPKV